jgi:hypothetical protein
VLVGVGGSAAAGLVPRFVGHFHDLRERFDGREPQLGGLAVAEELLAAPGEDGIDGTIKITVAFLTERIADGGPA